MRLPPALLVLPLLLAACSGGVRPARPSNGQGARPAGFDLAAVVTPAATPASDGLGLESAAAKAALQDLAPLTGGIPISLPLPQFLYGNSTLDTLELAQAASAPYDAVPGMLRELGWGSLVIRNGATDIDGGYRQWTVRIYRFGSGGAAAAYAQNPFLLPAPLGAAGAQPAPAALGPGAALRRAPDTISSYFEPGHPVEGERAAIDWSRGALAFEVIQSAAPAGADLTPLQQLVLDLDRRAGDLAP
jgi:hypothetical protein